MPAAANSSDSPPQGIFFPAAPAAQDALIAAAGEGASRQELIDAFEVDPGLLLQAFCSAPSPVSSISEWHRSFSTPMLRAMALARGLTTTEINQSGQDHKPLHRAILAGALAEHLDVRDSAASRLTALLADTGLWLRPGIAIDLDQHATRAANYLATLGCEPSCCDAIRYQHEPLAALVGTPLVVRLMAVTKVLHETVTPDAALISQCAQTLDLDAAEIRAAIDTTAESFHQAVAGLKPTATRGARHSLVIDAVLTDVLAGGASDEDIQGLCDRLVQFLFGHLQCYLFEKTADDGLYCRRAELHLAAGQRSSRIIETARRQQLNFARVSDLDLVAERHLASSADASYLLLLPLPEDTGVVTIPLTSSPEALITRDRILLLNMAAVVAARLRESPVPQPGGDTLPLDLVEQRAREITHEVNNPLTIMQNYLKTLAVKLDGDDRVTGELGALNRELSRVRGIIQRYQEIGRPAAIHYSNVDLNSLVSEQLALVQATAPGIQFSFDADQGIPVLELPGDTIKQITMNILKNAVEATQSTPTPQVSVSTAAAVNVDGRANLELTITDTGVGMTQEQRLALFSGGSSLSTKGAGRGMGLNIVRQLLGEIGGSISCRAAQPRGTTFQVLVPVGRPA